MTSINMALSRINSAKGKAVLRLLGAVIAIGSLIAVAWFALQSFNSGLSLNDIHWTLLIAATLVQLAGLALMPLLWFLLLKFLWESGGNEISSDKLLNLYTSYSRSWLARYIPGRIWMFGGRLLFATRIGIPSEVVIRSMAFETILVYGTITIIGAWLFLSAESHYFVGLMMLVLGLAALGIGIPIVQRALGVTGLIAGNGDAFTSRVIQFARRITLGDKPLPIKGSLWQVAVYGLLSCSQLAFIVLVAQSFVDLTLGQALIIAGAWGFSTTLGYFVIIAPGPGGLGVRDGIALAFFSQVIDLPTAALIVGVSRMLMIVTDIVFVAAIEAVVVMRRISQRTRSSSVGIEAAN